MKSYFRQNGFTILELIAVLVVMGVIAQGVLLRESSNNKKILSEKAVRHASNIATVSKVYRETTGNWPSSVADLVNSGYITSSEALPTFGGNYTFSVNPTSQALTIDFDVDGNDYKNRIQGLLPNGTTTAGGVAFSMPLSGTESSLSALYALDGSRPLTGDMNVNGNNLNNVNDVGANRFVDRQGGTVDPSGNTSLNQVQINSANITNLVADNGNIRSVNADNIATRNLRSTGSVSSRSLNVSGVSVFEGRTFFRDQLQVRGRSEFFSPVNVTSDMRVGGNLSASRVNAAQLNITRSSTVGNRCSIGDIGRTATGEILSCSNGTFQTAVGGAGEQYQELPFSAASFRGVNSSSGYTLFDVSGFASSSQRVTGVQVQGNLDVSCNQRGIFDASISVRDQIVTGSPFVLVRSQTTSSDNSSRTVGTARVNTTGENFYVEHRHDPITGSRGPSGGSFGGTVTSFCFSAASIRVLGYYYET